MSIEVDVDDVIVYIDEELAKLTDDETMLAIHQDFKKRMTPFVPMSEGFLSQGATPTSQYVVYHGPYAHYQYIGLVYGPNIPILDDNNNIIGWWSPPNKHPTGENLTYSKEFHPLATHHWDQAMMEADGSAFIKDVETILKRRLKE